MQRTLRLLAIVSGLCASTQAFAQKYPARPVKIAKETRELAAVVAAANIKAE